MARPRKDLTGATRGKLKIISIDQEKGKWICKCECGNIIYLSSHEWFYNQPSSCGCAKRKDITDKKYGLLTAKYPTGELDKFRRALWYCECECGGHKIVATTDLEAGLVKSCGCLYKNNHKNIGRVAKEWLKDGTDLRKINAIHPYKGNSTGFRGVVKNKKTGRYSATIFFKGKITRLGTYDTPEEASAAYLEAKKNLQTEYQNELSEASSVPTHESIIKKGKEKLVYYIPENRYVNITELSKLSGVNRATLYSRLERGYSGEKLWNKKVNKKNTKILVNYEGKDVTLTELSTITGIPYHALYSRYCKGLRGGNLVKEIKKAIIYVKYNGERMTLYELSKKSGIDYSVLYQRYSKGIRGAQLLENPNTTKMFVDYEGKKISLMELSKITGIKYNTLYIRYARGARGKKLWGNIHSEIEIDYQSKAVSLNELSNITKIPYNTLLNRYQNGDRGEDLWRPSGQRKKTKKKK